MSCIHSIQFSGEKDDGWIGVESEVALVYDAMEMQTFIQAGLIALTSLG